MAHIHSLNDAHPTNNNAHPSTNNALDQEDLLDPHPDLHDLFVHYNTLYFNDSLGSVSVEWSSRKMTSCGGTCQRVPGGAIIRLSAPILSLRPSRDLKAVLLHEMIHAYIMVNNIPDPSRDPTGHGAPFLQKAHEINTSTVEDGQRPGGRAGYRITVRHPWIDEVKYYQQHKWRCGRCGDEVQRAMNRKPQPADCLGYRKERGDLNCRNYKLCKYHRHAMRCGGDYVKIQSPPTMSASTGEGGAPPPPLSKKKKKRNNVQNNDLSKWLTNTKEVDESPVVPSIETVLLNNNSNEPSKEERRRAAEAAALKRIQTTKVEEKEEEDIVDLTTSPE